MINQLNFKKNKKVVAICCLLFSFMLNAQQNNVNVDSLYYKANNLYKKSKLKQALPIVNRALKIAPEYIDIRVLRIRIAQRLKVGEISKKDLKILLSDKTKQEYRLLTLNQLNLSESKKELNDFIDYIDDFYKDDIDYDLSKAEAYHRLKNTQSAKKTVNKLSKLSLNEGQTYRYRRLLKQLNSNQISINYELNTFAGDYSRTSPWNTFQLGYMKFIGKHSVGARVTYSERFTDDATLYELESYPVISDKMYGFVKFECFI